MNKILIIINEKLTMANELMQSGQLQDSYNAIENADQLLTEIKNKHVDEKNLLLVKDSIKQLKRKLNNMMVKVVKSDNNKKTLKNEGENKSLNQN